MAKLRLWTVLLMVVASALSAAAQSTAQKREITLNLTLPNGGTPVIRGAEGETATVTLPGVGKFGFAPTVREDKPGVVLVEVFDLNRTPRQRLARLEVIVGGERMPSRTTPEFGIEVPSVLTR